MRSQKLLCVIAVSAFAVSSVPFLSAAQGNQGSKHKDHHYKLIDLGTLGGPIGYGSVNGDGFRLLNNSGVVASFADTPLPDPNSAYFCYDPDCFQAHAFRWNDGVMTDIGALPGNNNSAAGSINSHGWVTGQSQSSTIDPNLGIPEFRAVLWRENQITDLGTLPGGTEALGIYVNDGDQVVGFSDNGMPDPFSSVFFLTGTQIHTFLWKNDAMQDIGTLGGPDAGPGANCGVLPPDQIVGASYTTYSPNSGTGLPTLDPFFWNDGIMTDLGTLGGTIGNAQCGNSHGQIIGNSDLPGDLITHAFLWQDGAMSDLGTLGGNNSVALWLNKRGDVAGYAERLDQTHHPVLWKHGKIRDLGTVQSDPCGQALSVNARGQVVGGTSDCSFFLHAFLWEHDGPMLDLNRLIPAGSGLRLTFAININDRGEILAKSIPPGVSPFQDADLYGHLVLLVPCEAETKESCESSPAQPAANAAIAQSIAVNGPKPSAKFTTRPQLGKIDLHHRFGVLFPK
jgi:probable HAF family extracellular repeat protein